MKSICIGVGDTIRVDEILTENRIDDKSASHSSCREDYRLDSIESLKEIESDQIFNEG